MATSSGAYKLAVATAHRAEFNGLLGTPVSEGWFSEGKIDVGNPATGDLLISVCGRLRSGNLRAFVVKDDGGWRLKDLTLPHFFGSLRRESHLQISPDRTLIAAPTRWATRTGTMGSILSSRAVPGQTYGQCLAST